MCRAFIGCLFLLICAGAQAQEQNLLLSSAARLVSMDLNASEQRFAERLVDADLTLSTPDAVRDVSLVFAFDEIVSPSRLRIHLAAESDAGIVGEVTLLSSLVSPQTGYQVLRVSTVTGDRLEQSSRFQAVGTRWLMIRFSIADKAKFWGVSEIELFGQRGPPASVYAFKESPAAALDVMSSLDSQLQVNATPEEYALFADAADGQLDTWTLAEAALLASGVNDSATRAVMLRDIDRLHAGAYAALDGEPGPMARAEHLLGWLHDNALNAGYREKQTSLSDLLQSGTYNCVSSAVLYSILGQQLGLDVRGIEVPDHALAVVYDGPEHADVETTTRGGFNPTRNRASLEAFEATTGFAYIPDRRPDKRREVSTLGLISLIYYNRGVALSAQGDYPGALSYYFRALSLDHNAGSAVKNALATLSNWSASLANEHRYDEALEVVRLGLSLAPDDRNLNHTHRVIWQRRIAAAADNADFDAFSRIVSEAHSALPEAGFDSQQSLFLIERAQTLADEGRWSEALARVVTAVPVLNEAAARSIDDYRLNLLLRWSNAEIDAHRWTQALAVLERGMEVVADNRKIAGNLAYLLQEWSEEVFQASGAEAAEAVINDVAARFPELDGLRRVGRNYAIRRVNELRRDGRYDEALLLISDYEALIGSDQDFATLVRGVFDAQAGVFLDAGQMDAALSVYARAAAAFPGNRQIRRNQVAVWHRWASSYMDDKQWQAALGVYERAMNQLPSERSFRQNTTFILQEWLSELDPTSAGTVGAVTSMYARARGQIDVSPIVAAYFSRAVEARIRASEFETALSIARLGATLVRDQNESVKVVRYAYDQWARVLAEQEDWHAATDVYARGLGEIPVDSRLRNNAVATWHEWAESYMDRSQWAQAIEIYEKGLDAMPGTRLFGNNIRYCIAQRDGS